MKRLDRSGYIDRLCVGAGVLGESVTVIDPLGHVIEEVLHRVRILARSLLACGARLDAVRGPVDDNKILVLAGGYFKMNLVIADEIVSAHGGEQYRHGNVPHGAGRRVVAGAPIDSIHG